MWLTVLWQYRTEILYLIVALAIAAAVWHIKHTYDTVDVQRAQIDVLIKEVEGAKRAIQLQSEIDKAKGRIDQKVYSSVRAITDRPVPRVLVPQGQLRPFAAAQ